MSDTQGAALAITCGLPRSGKTTAVQRLEADGWVCVCPDDIRYALHGAAFIAQAEPHVWAVAETMARALLIRGRQVIVDATNTTVARRRPWVAMAKEFGLKLDIYHLETSYEVCLARNGGKVDPSVIERMHRQFEPPTHAEGRILVPLGDSFIVLRSFAEHFDRQLRIP